MPKINVYLPDDLAEAVKSAGVPVSAVCQRALEQAVRRVTAIRETVLTEVDLEQPTGALTHMTARTRTVLKLATEQARAEGAAAVGTEHLLGGMLSEGTNLALRVLATMEIADGQLRAALDRHRPAEPGTGAPERFGPHAAAALELAVTEATALGHNYVGCEHLLLGLIAEPDGTAGEVLRSLGADLRLTRRAVSAALAGYVHLRAQTPQAPPPEAVGELLTAAVRRELAPFAERLDRLEARLGENG
ncbi:Clp protease N-terminal domain-containing protein [Nonomuraea aridisoli]|uniref:Peptidase n=1 Tax=Nonomuraea aridisoli TaxID=2070368 RepID=A0A2W2DZJ5_9ACTN|nr:Clp protease N-terminal domain-containing protein [Nonomuraea aridisoli]PZG06600.1 peptidase [Nonomuraea aridisoli]